MKILSLLSLVIIFSISSQSHAQTSKFEYGIKAGANYSKFTTDFDTDVSDHLEYQRKVGFYLGGFLSKKISEKLYFQPELHFSLRRTDFLVKGVEIRTNDPNAGSTVLNIETNITESIIAVPLMMRYYFTQSFFIDAGPEVGFIIDSSEKIENDPFEEPGNPGTGTDYNYDKFDLGLSLGTGHTLTEDLIINARYLFGIIERDNSINSSVFNLGLEYKF